MKKAILLVSAALLSSPAIAADSVYSWGAWSQGLKPAAGGFVQVTPPPVQKPEVNFRPNENKAFGRTQRVQTVVTVATAQPVIVVPEVVVDRAPPISTTLPTTPPPPPAK